jgi:hypothetical protein
MALGAAVVPILGMRSYICGSLWIKETAMYQPARRYSRSLSVAAVFLLAGCASTSAPLNGGVSSGPSIQESSTQSGDRITTVPQFKVAQRTTVPVPVADAWTRLAKAYSDLGIPLTTVQPDAHVLGNEGMKRSHTLANQRLSQFLDCGSGGSGSANADVYSINMSVVSRLSPTSDNGTEVATLIQATATPMTFGTAPVVCSTTGALEARIASMVGGNTPTK